MSWPQKESIVPSVVEMLRMNMGLQSGERLLVVTDVPRTRDWQAARQAELEEMLERAMLARLVSAIAAQHFPDCSVNFLPFSATGLHGTEPDETAAARMREADVVIALTTYSLSHTNGRQAVTEAGGRLASMAGFEARMFEAGGPMAVDHQKLASDCQALADRLTAASEVIVRTPYGTDLRFSMKGRSVRVDTGLYRTKGQWGNLPAGEVYTSPLEGTGEGQLVAPAGWHPNQTQDMIFRFKQGRVVELLGGGTVGDKFRRLLDLASDDPIRSARGNLAELGIGTNPNARKPDNVLEAEKIKGTIHIAIGDNKHMGGQVESDLHEDFVQPQPDLIVDGKPMIFGGVWKF